MSSTIVFEDSSMMHRVCGINDRNIPYLELLLGGDLFVHGNSLIHEVSEECGSSADLFLPLIQRLQQLALHHEDITEPEIFMEYQALRTLPEKGVVAQSVQETPAEPIVISVGGKTIHPKSLKQRVCMNMMLEKQIVFSIGPAGTGKTFLAIAQSLSEVLSGRRQKIVLTRPVVEAGENLGFLPGDLSQKIHPYLRPLHDAMEYMLPPTVIRRLEDNGSIEIAPLAYMRGRSLNNACVILDEAQNTTIEQMKMFLTRLGENAVAIITGDITQIDLPKPGRSGLVHASSILRDIPGIGFIEFSSSDVVRSRIVQRIIDAYENSNCK